MKKIFCMASFLFVITGAEAQENMVSTMQMQCPLKTAVFAEDACSNPHFFRTDVAPKIEAINQLLQKNLDDLFHDNQAFPEFMATESVKNFRIYHYCFEDLCQQVYKSCSGTNMNTRPMSEYQWCLDRQTALERLQKQKIHYIAVGNIERKNRSLLEEKINALGYRFNQFIHPRMREISALLDKLKSRIEALIKYPKT